MKLWDVRTGKTIRHCHSYLYSATLSQDVDRLNCSNNTAARVYLY